MKSWLKRNYNELDRLMEYKEQGVKLSDALVKLSVKENKKLEEKPSFWKSSVNFYQKSLMNFHR